MPLICRSANATSSVQYPERAGHSAASGRLGALRFRSLRRFYGDETGNGCDRPAEHLGNGIAINVSEVLFAAVLKHAARAAEAFARATVEQVESHLKDVSARLQDLLCYPRATFVGVDDPH